jgi:hypothetical protein
MGVSRPKRSRAQGTSSTRTRRTLSTPKVKSSQQPAESDRFREAVSRLAYHFWEVRNLQDGGPDEDWLRAERAVQEVLEKMSPRST